MNMGLEINVILAYAVGLILLYTLGWILMKPIRLIIKMIWNGILGGIILVVLNIVGKYFGIIITVNPVTALIVGFLGIPGVILLILLNNIL